MRAEIENITFDDFTDVPVVAIVYDTDGNAMAASQSFISEIGDGERQALIFTWPRPFPRDLSRIEVTPRINPFVPNKF